MYQAVADPYCYPGTTVLKNLAGLRRQSDLDRFEAVMVAQRFEEPLPAGRLSATHYRAVHRHLFGDVYAWAGKYRTVRMSKGPSQFCYPENIPGEMARLFRELRHDRYGRGLSTNEFAGWVAHVIAELNAIHPFREGNGRTQNAFLVVLALQAGHPVDLTRFDPERMLHATIASFGGHERLLADAIVAML